MKPSYYQTDDFKVANKTNNPFINLATSILNSSQYISFEIIMLFDYLLSKNEFDINESFFVYNDDGQNIHIVKKNIFDILLTTRANSISDKQYLNFFKKLFEHGLKIEEQTVYTLKNTQDIYLQLINNPKKEDIFNLIKQNQIKQRNQNALFQETIFPEQQNIFTYFFKEAKKQYKDDYINKIKEYETYHKIVNHNHFKIVALFASQLIPTNILNHKNSTPLMHVSTLQMAKTLDDLGANWLAIDDDNKDALSYFTENHNKEESLLLMKYGTEKNKTLLDNNNINIDYIKDRNSINLISLVNSNKNKTELIDFINKNQTHDIKNIVDNDNNNLLMLSIKKQDWAKCKIFLDYMDDTSLELKNNSGLTALEILLIETNLKRIKDTNPIVKRLLEHHQKIIGKSNISFYSKLLKLLFIHKPYRIKSFFNLPEILLTQDNITHLTYLDYNIEELKKQDYVDFKNYSYPSDEAVEQILNFYIKGFMKEKEINPNVKFDIDIDMYLKEILFKEINYKKETIYKVEDILFRAFKVYINFIEKIDRNLYIDGMNKTNKYIISFINDNLLDIEKRFDNLDFAKINKQKFLNNIKPLLLFFIDNNNLEYLSQINEDIFDYDYQNSKINNTLEYIYLNKYLPKPTDKPVNKKNFFKI